MKNQIILIVIAHLIILGCVAQKTGIERNTKIDSLVVQYYAFTSKTPISLDEEYLSKIKNDGKFYGKTVILKDDDVSNLYSHLSNKLVNNSVCQVEDFRMMISFYSNGNSTIFLLDKKMVLSNNFRCATLDTISQKQLFKKICKPKWSDINFEEKKVWKYAKTCI